TLVDFPVQAKSGLLRDLAGRAARKLGLPADAISAALLARESLGSTGIGGGIAIPHARLDGLSKPFAIFTRLPRPLDFEAIDAKPIDLVFLLLLPGGDNEGSLAALALAARKLRSAEEVARLRSARKLRDLFEMLTASR